MAVYVEPKDTCENWIPKGYRFVSEPGHVLKATDCGMPILSNDWRYVHTMNAGERIGKAAKDVDHDIQYFITKDED